jgi:MazG family protein
MGPNAIVKLVKILRAKCPWDKKQTLSSLKNNLVEETYEVVEAIENNDLKSIKEEVGDLLFLGFFLARILEEKKSVTMDELTSSTVRKYRAKHPHVFKNKKFKTPDEVVRFWHGTKKDIFAGIPITLPALLAAKVIQERAAKVGFDWRSKGGPMKKIAEETRELRRAKRPRRIFEETGDLLFSCVNLARHLGVDPEDALRHANRKFVKRFRLVEKNFKKSGKQIKGSSLQEMDRVWDRIKRD